MHNACFRELDLPYSFSAISIPEADLKKKFFELKESGYKGLNITIPHKEPAVFFLDEISDRVRKLEAVNTVVFDGKSALGENTDVDGAARSLEEAGYVSKPGDRAFLFGAGGACKAAVEAFYSLGVKRFAATSRTPGRLERFAEWFRKNYAGGEMEILPYESLSARSFNAALHGSRLFSNAAPLDACKEIPFFPEIQFPEGMFVVEWVYRPRMTPWLEKAGDGKAGRIEGYKILLHQGLEAFKLWTGIEAPKEVMEKVLLEELH